MAQIRKTILKTAAICIALLIFTLSPTGIHAAQAQSADTNPEASEATEAETSEAESTSKKKMELTTDDFHIRAVPGLGGYSKPGVPLPLTVYVESINNDFEGILRVIVPGEQFSRDAVAYEKDVMLTAGTEKTISTSVENVSSISPLRIELENTAGKTVLNYDITLQGQSAENALVGILSDDFTALNYMDGKSVHIGTYTGITQVIELGKDNFPDQASSLEPLSYLVINSYDTSALSEEQLNALKSWVKTGGILIIGTGSDYQQTLSGFQDGFVNGSVGAAQSGELLLAEPPEESAAVPFAETDGVVTLSMSEGAPLENVLSNPELIWAQPAGQGRVIVTAFNLGMEPVNSWSAKGDMAKILLEQSATGYGIQRIEQLNYGNYMDTWTLSNALDSLHEILKPNMPLFIILFIVFVVLVGPGLYLILKAVDKRGFIWVIIPVLSVAVTGGVFLFSRNMRIHEPQMASITDFYYDAETDGRSQKAYIGIQVPNASRTTVTLNNTLSNLSVVPGNNYNISLFGVSSNNENLYNYKTAVRELPEGYQLGLRNGVTFESSYFTADCTAESKLPENNGLETTITNTISGIKGSVTNNSGYDLKGVSVYTHNRMVILGSMKAGETKEFDVADNKQFQFSYDSFSSIYHNINGSPASEEEQRELTQLNNAWNIFGQNYLSSINDMSAYTFAYLPEWETNYFSSEKTKEKGAAILVRRDPAAYEDYPGASNVNLYQYAIGNPSGWDGDGWLNGDEVEVAFDVHENISQVYAFLKSEEDTSMYGGTGKVTILGLNQQTGEYDVLFADSSLIEFKDGCPYMGSDGIISLKFIAGSQNQSDYAPPITVIGGGN
ncbi:MAG: hypothetical protein HFG80_08580 [Eubacterium sp.]|nr:hypothetical protein [Eubacterium sp.]